MYTPVNWYLLILFVYVGALICVCLVGFFAFIDSATLATTAESNDKPLWQSTKQAEFVHPTTGAKFRTSVSEYRSWVNRNTYGVGLTNRERTDERGYTRSLLDYRRTNVIYVPDESADTVSCDTWVNQNFDDQQFFSNQNGLIECRLNEGSDACFKCRESRRYKRVCVHFPVNQTIVSANNKEHVIVANSSPDVGWCLPASFKDIQFDNEGGTGKPPPEIARNCNPNTGDWLLASLSASGNETVDSSYNWICRCRYPNLMTNLDDPTSDCLKPVGCRPNGRLDDKAAAGLVDPYRQGTCICDKYYKTGFSPDIGPTCNLASVTDYGLNKALDDVFGRERGSIIDLEFVSTAFLNLLPADERRDVRLNNPCHFDVLDGRELPQKESCELTVETIGKERRAFCVSHNIDHIAVRVESDYLLNNHGRYANACLYTGHTRNRVNLKQVADEKPGGTFHLSYYNKKRYPDVGHIIRPDVYEEKSREQKRAYQIMAFFDTDREYLQWYIRFVSPYKNYATEASYQLRFNASYMYELDRTFVIFNDYPDVDERYSFGLAIVKVPFQMDIYNLLLEQSPSTCAPKAIMTLIDRDIFHPKRFTYYAFEYDVFLYMDVSWYNSWEPYKNQRNCLGAGRLLVDQPIDTLYREINPDQMPAGLRQFFVSGNQNEYPSDYSFNECFSCAPVDGKISDQIKRDTPKMWPVVVFGNRQLVPNKYHRTFDATVQVFITTNFACISTTGNCGNFLDYRSEKNVSLLERRPDGLDDFAS